MNVEQCMTKSPRACTQADSLSTVARLLWEHDLGALPVVDHAGAVVGMITDRDLCMAAYTSGLPLHATHVGRHMSRTVFSIGAKAEAAKAAELMKSRKVRRLPVVENGRLVGIVALSDIARTAGRNGKLRGLSGDEVAQVLASVTEPRAIAPVTPAVANGTAPKAKPVFRAKPRALAKKR
jgi:CBS domain-containing protein